MSGNDPADMRRSTTITKSPNLLDKETRELVVTNLMNQAFICIYDGNNEEAINIFRQIQTYKPANIVAANNLATCKIFLNKVNESIKIIEDLINKDKVS